MTGPTEGDMFIARTAPKEGSPLRAEVRRPVLLYAAALLLLAVPLLGTYFASISPPPGLNPTGRVRSPIAAPAAREAPPPVEPTIVKALNPEDARAINAAIPFSTASNPAARPFRFSGANADKDRAIDCLAAAQYYEAGDDPVGQKAVAQVVLNRARHPAFPQSICEVVFQGAERSTGCQFTFTCDGSMQRTPPRAAWDRARALASRMLSGLVDREVGHATHYHTDWVVPYWSDSLEKITEVRTHLFFRWPGGWGRPAAFRQRAAAAEPAISLLARLSPAHAGADGELAAEGFTAPQMGVSAAGLAAAPKEYEAGSRPAPASPDGPRLVATSPEKDAFILELPSAMATGDYLAAAQTFCSGRSKCRILGWRSDAPPPSGFPIPGKALPSMRFSYIHDAASGLQRLLWNCRAVPQPDQRNCMKERMPLGNKPL